MFTWSGATYRMIFGKRYTFDVLRGLTVGLKKAAHGVICDVIGHQDVQIHAENDSDDGYIQARYNCSKVDYV